MSGLTLSWTHDTPDGLTYNVYENGALIVDNVGTLHFSVNMSGRADGEYTYQVSSVRTSDGMEGDKSAAVSVNFMQPPAPPVVTITVTN